MPSKHAGTGAVRHCWCFTVKLLMKKREVRGKAALGLSVGAIPQR